ncbi:T3SS (YopN, CesT) and YbjN peptide-binding chaperone 1 [Rhodococcus sp. O3]|uniref:T3SS (YopN, CesT) and YbjN peptide-binding chaperone 1 n=1 Tax=Rhodococcus sp. O3 TaxID=3404919 RepID=UPI003B670EAC
MSKKNGRKKGANKKRAGAEVVNTGTADGAQSLEELWVVPVDTEDDDALRDAVRRILADVLDEAPEPDEDGDLPIWLGDVITYASVDAEDAVVELRTFLVERIAGRTRAAEVLGDLQSEWPDFKFVLHKDRVTAEQRVPASPLVPMHLIRAVGAIVPLVEEARVLASRLGGEACVFDGADADDQDSVVQDSVVQETGVEATGTDRAVGGNLLADAGCGCGNCDCG